VPLGQERALRRRVGSIRAEVEMWKAKEAAARKEIESRSGGLVGRVSALEKEAADLNTKLAVLTGERDSLKKMLAGESDALVRSREKYAAAEKRILQLEGS